MRYFLAILSVIILLTGCQPPSIGRHDYTVAVVNRSGNPVSGVSVSGNSLDRAYRHERLHPVGCKTSKDGLCVLPVKTTLGYYVDDRNYTKKLITGSNDRYDGEDWRWGFATAISVNTDHFEYFTLPDNRYFTSFDVEKDVNMSKSPVSVPTFVIKLVSVKELLCTQQINSKEDIKAARQKILATVDTVRKKASNKDYEILSFQSSSLKDKDYISINIDFPVVFNSERMSRYENIREIVDRVVRGVVGTMDVNLRDWCVDGYHIMVHAERRSFIHEKTRTVDPLKESLVLDIYIPKEMVQQYTQLEITGQRLIDSSIVLLNGERIDVKMQ